jgi:hypothetical protein
LFPNEVAINYFEKKAAYNILEEFISLKTKSELIKDDQIVDILFIDYLNNQTKIDYNLKSVNISQKIIDELFQKVNFQNVTYQELKNDKANHLKIVDEKIKFYWTILNCKIIITVNLSNFRRTRTVPSRTVPFPNRTVPNSNFY